MGLHASGLDSKKQVPGGHPNSSTLDVENKDLAQFVVKKLGYKRWAIISDPTVYGVANAENFGNEVKKNGGEVVSVDFAPVGTMDFRPILTKVNNLKPKPVKIGDIWPTDDTVSSKAGTTTLKQITHAENTFAGIETIDGVECAKITSVLTGTRETSAQTMGTDFTQSFKFTGTSDLFFAIRARIFYQADTQ